MSYKIKLTLGMLVNQPAVQSMGGQMMVTGYAFTNALTKLGEDLLPLKERYAIAKTLKEVQDWITAFEKKRNDWIRDNGKKLSVILAAQLEQERSTKREGSLAKYQAVQIERMEEQLAGYAKNPAQDQFSLDPSDTEKQKAFESMIAKEKDTEIELAYLNHRIELVADTKLTAAEILLLEPLVQEP